MCVTDSCGCDNVQWPDNVMTCYKAIEQIVDEGGIR